MGFRLPHHLIIRILEYLTRLYHTSSDHGKHVDHFLKKMVLVSKKFTKRIVRKLVLWETPIFVELNRDTLSMVKRLSKFGANVNLSVTVDGSKRFVAKRERILQRGNVRVHSLVIQSNKDSLESKDLSELKVLSLRVDSSSFLHSVLPKCKGLEKLEILKISHLDARELVDALLPQVSDGSPLLKMVLGDQNFNFALENAHALSSLSSLGQLTLSKIPVQSDQLCAFVSDLPKNMVSLNLDYLEVSDPNYANQLLDILYEKSHLAPLESLTCNTLSRTNEIYFSKVARLLNANKTLKSIEYRFHFQDVPFESVFIDNHTLRRWKCLSPIDYGIFKEGSALQSFFFNSMQFMESDFKAVSLIHFQNITTLNVSLVLEEAFRLVCQLIELNPPNMTDITFSREAILNRVKFDIKPVINSLSLNKSISRLSIYDQIFDTDFVRDFLSLRHPNIKHLYIFYSHPIDYISLEKELVATTLTSLRDCSSLETIPHLRTPEKNIEFLSRLFSKNRTLETFSIPFSEKPMFGMMECDDSDSEGEDEKLNPKTFESFKKAIQLNPTIKRIQIPEISYLLLDCDILVD